MSRETLPIAVPVLPSPLPTNQQSLMNIFYNHWQAHSQMVRDHNKSLDEDSDEIFVKQGVEGMMRSANQEEIANVMPPIINAAVILGNHNYQIGNGGWSQWDGNGYSASIDMLEGIYSGAVKFGIEGADEVLEMIQTFRKRKDDEESGSRYSRHNCFNDDDDFDEDDDGMETEDLDARFYEKDREPMMQQILDNFQEIAGMALMQGKYRS